MGPTDKSSSTPTGQLIARLGLKTDCGCNFHSIRFAETNMVNDTSPVPQHPKLKLVYCPPI